MSIAFKAEVPDDNRIQPTALPLHTGDSKCCQVVFSTKALARSGAAAELAACGPRPIEGCVMLGARAVILS